MPVRLLPQSVPEDAATHSRAVPLFVGVSVTVQPPSIDPPEMEISAAAPIKIGPDAPSGVGRTLNRFPDESRKSSWEMVVQSGSEFAVRWAHSAMAVFMAPTVAMAFDHRDRIT